MSGRLPKKLAETIQKIRARAPDALGPPDGPERVIAAEKCLGRPLPKDYAAFLAHVGRIQWPCEIGNLVDYRRPEIEPRFAPFSPVIDGWCHGFVRDRAPARQRADLDAQAKEIRESRAYRKKLAASGDDERRDDARAYVEQLDEELEGVRARAAEVAERRLPANFAIDSYEIETGALATLSESSTWSWSDPVPARSDDDDAPERVSFSDWLARSVDEALGGEEAERTRPAREAAEREAEWAAAASDLPERARRRERALDGARTIIAWLIETKKLEVAGDFDAEAAATQLVPRVMERWADGILDALADRDDVIDVFASAEDLEAIWSHSSNGD